VIDVRGSVGVG